MSGRRTEQDTARRRALHDATPGWKPQLGDLAYDIKRWKRGVVVGIPDGIACLTYHLRPPEGGDEWSAAADGSTLRPVCTITHVTPAGEVSYDARARQGAVPILLHHEDGTTEESTFVVTLDELATHVAQLARLVRDREGASTP